jgi:hypothetical protein
MGAWAGGGKRSLEGLNEEQRVDSINRKDSIKNK